MDSGRSGIRTSGTFFRIRSSRSSGGCSSRLGWPAPGSSWAGRCRRADSCSSALGGAAAAVAVGRWVRPHTPVATGRCGELAGRQIRWIVPNAPGGGYDAESRLIEPFLERQIGAEIVVENRTGSRWHRRRTHDRDGQARRPDDRHRRRAGASRRCVDRNWQTLPTPRPTSPSWAASAEAGTSGPLGAGSQVTDPRRCGGRGADRDRCRSRSTRSGARTS